MSHIYKRVMSYTWIIYIVCYICVGASAHLLHTWPIYKRVMSYTWINRAARCARAPALKLVCCSVLQCVALRLAFSHVHSCTFSHVFKGWHSSLTCRIFWWVLWFRVVFLFRSPSFSASFSFTLLLSRSLALSLSRSLSLSLFLPLSRSGSCSLALLLFSPSPLSRARALSRIRCTGKCCN